MIIACGPLFKQRSSVAYRIVLRSLYDGGYVVHNQLYPYFPDMKSFNFGSGNYFKKDELARAMKCFAYRVTQHAEYVDAIEGEVPW